MEIADPLVQAATRLAESCTLLAIGYNLRQAGVLRASDGEVRVSALRQRGGRGTLTGPGSWLGGALGCARVCSALTKVKAHASCAGCHSRQRTGA